MPFNPGSYKVIRATTAEEAIAKSPFYVGQLAQVREIQVSANGDGTWTVVPLYLITQDKPCNTKP